MILRLALALVFAGTCFFAPFAGSAAAQGVTLTLAPATVSPGQTFTMTLSASDLAGLNVTAFNTTLTYDTAQLTFVGVSLDGTLSGPDAAGMTLVHNAATPGSVVVVAAGATPIEGGGPIAVVTFTAGAATGTTDVTVGSIVLNEGQPAATGVAGTVTIRSMLYGDATLNGEVTAYDAAKILQHATEIDAISGDGLEAADVTGNGTISAYDAALVLHKVSGSLVCFPVDAACAASKREPAPASVALAWGTPRQEGGETRVALLLAGVDGPAYAFDASVVLQGTLPAAIEPHAPDGVALLHRAEVGGFRVAVASSSPLAPDTLLTLRFAGAPDLAAIDALVRVNEADPVRIAVDEPAEAPASFTLTQNYPNPFNPVTRIRYAIAETTPVRLAVYDVLGREVRVLVDGPQGAGHYDILFDAASLPSGAYFYRLDAGAQSQTRQMVLMK